MGDFSLSLAAYDEAIQQFSKVADDSDFFMAQFMIMQSKNAALIRHNEIARAFDAWNDFVERLKQRAAARGVSSNLAAMVQLANMMKWGFLLSWQHEGNMLDPEAVKMLNEEIQYRQTEGNSELLALLLQVRAVMQEQVGDLPAALHTLDEIIRRFQNESAANMRGVYGWTLGKKAAILFQQGDRANARKLCEEILRRFEQDTPTTVTGLVEGVKQMLKETQP
jgi:tetratricopeptide (TPR) repeat protein